MVIELSNEPINKQGGEEDKSERAAHRERKRGGGRGRKGEGNTGSDRQGGRLRGEGERVMGGWENTKKKGQKGQHVNIYRGGERERWEEELREEEGSERSTHVNTGKREIST